MIRGLATTVVFMLCLAAILFVSAGRVDWPLGWAVLGVWIVVIVAAVLLVDPDLIQERSQMRSDSRLDPVVAGVSFLLTTPLTLLVAGLDAGRFGWSPPIGLVPQLVAFAVLALGFAVSSWASVCNRFYSSFVRIQTDRGHTVVTDGPYAYVRHPGYAGFILASLAAPLALGSLWALLPTFIGACGFVVRTALEDRFLQRELSGYPDYAGRVPYRLFPGVW